MTAFPSLNKIYITTHTKKNINPEKIEFPEKEIVCMCIKLTG